MEKCYAHVNEDGKVYGVSQNASLMVPIPTYDSNYMGTTYDEETGEFSGIRPVLLVDKMKIQADGEDSATVTVMFQHWDGAPADYEKELVFSINGSLRTVAKQDDTYTLVIQGSEVGFQDITVMNEDLMESNRVRVTLVTPN